MTTLVTGGTGFVGQRLLVAAQAAGNQMVVTSRNSDRARKKLGTLVSTVIAWDPLANPIEFENDNPVSAVINLMGEPIAEGRWTQEKKNRIRDSRIIGTRHLIDGLINSSLPLPQVLVSASAVGIYGNSGENVVDENHAFGSGFLPEVCEQWESEADRIREHGVRVVNLRIGIVLGTDGGALKELLPIFRWGVGGRLGSGKQWVPWIHVDDLVRLILWCRDTPTVHGPINATAPNPVRNRMLTEELARCLRRPALLPAPKFAVKLALGEFADSLFFSQQVIPEKALSQGFSFQFPELRPALQDLLQ